MFHLIPVFSRRIYLPEWAWGPLGLTDKNTPRHQCIELGSGITDLFVDRSLVRTLARRERTCLRRRVLE